MEAFGFLSRKTNFVGQGRYDKKPLFVFLNKGLSKEKMKKYITREGLAKLKKELEELEIKGRREIANKLEKAIALGDLSDNAMYQEAKRDQAFLEGKILELKDSIRKSVVIENGGENKSIVEIGSTVIVKIYGDEQKLRIIGEAESDPLKGKISYQSPLGKALLGHRPGEAVGFETPGGKKKVEILKIE